MADIDNDTRATDQTDDQTADNALEADRDSTASPVGDNPLPQDNDSPAANSDDHDDEQGREDEQTQD